MHLDHYSTRGLQVTFKRTKVVKLDLLPYRLTITAFIPCRAETLFCNSTFGWSYANEASLKRNYSGVPLGSKVDYECDTLIILRATLIILRVVLNNLRATLIILRAT